MRRKLAVVLTFALASTGLAIGSSILPTDAATTPVTTPMNCTANTPIGSVAVSQDVTVTTTAPDGVENDTVFTVSSASDTTQAPSSASGFTVNSLRDLRMNIPIAANAVYVSHSLGADGIMPPGAGTPSLTYNAGANRLELSVPGPIPGGATFRIPTINTVLRAAGPAFATIQPKLSFFTTTVNVNFPSPIGASDVVTTCTPVAPVPALSTTTIIPPDVTAPTATIITPASGATYGLGQVVNASYSCSDPSPGSGVASCTGAVPNGSPIDTSSVGTKSFTVTAVDNKGNSSTTSTTYTVADVPAVSVRGGSVVEGSAPGAGGQLAFEVSLSKPSLSTVTLDYATVDGTAVAPGDYAPVTGSLTFTPGGSLSQTVLVDVAADLTFEETESLSLQITDTHGSASVGGSTPGRIIDDDAPPVRVSGGSVIEGPGASITFTVTPTRPSPFDVSVPYATVDGSATAGSDYTGVAGTLQFSAGSTAPQTVTVPVLEDALDEGDTESFSLEVTQYDGQVVAVGGTIVDDDGDAPADYTVPGFAIGDVSITESDQGDLNANVTVRLSGPAAVASQVQYRTIARTATAGVDFAQKTGTLKFGIGEVAKTVTVKIKPDLLAEADESFTVELRNPVGYPIQDPLGTVTIVDNDASTAPCCVATVAGTAVWEGDTGLGSVLVNVSLNRPATAPLTVKVATAPGTATALDFNSLAKNVTFQAGQQRKTVKVTIRHDNLREGDEQATVNLTAVSGPVTIGTPSAHLVILDDDHQPSAPENLAAAPDPDGLGLVTVTWDPPASGLAPPLAPWRYDVRVSTDHGATWGPWQPTGTGAGRSLVHDCGAGVTCTYQVRAYNSRGVGDPSAPADGVGYADTAAPSPSLVTPVDGANRDSWTALTYAGDLGLERGDHPAVDVSIRQGATVVQSFPGMVSGGSWIATAPAPLPPGIYTAVVEQSDWVGLVGSDSVVFEVRDAVFVSERGDNAAPGSAAAPKLTVPAAMAAAAAAGRPQVAVGAGSYNVGAGLSLASGVRLMGGFDQYRGWSRPGTAGAPGTADNTLTTLRGAPQAALASGAVTATVDGLTLQGTNSGLGAGASVYGLRAVNGAHVTLTNVRTRAEAGLPGTDGAHGANGVNGTAGAEGGTGWENCYTVPGRPPSPGGPGGSGAAAGGAGGSAPCPTP
ncbi:Calx-beta domain-containing protein, partial [Rhabdothermincola sediminis]|uniref:Calx-beta domain-containing protein n=1 Tax=Rhabdothermincola sediminis TaxID=2751370 RepID=UPI0027DA2C13